MILLIKWSRLQKARVNLCQKSLMRLTHGQGSLTEGEGLVHTVDPLIKKACFVIKVNNFINKKSRSKLVRTRRSTVLSLSHQQGFPVEMFTSGQCYKTFSLCH